MQVFFAHQIISLVESFPFIAIVVSTLVSIRVHVDQVVFGIVQTVDG